jgi:hypothetical protein
MHQSCSVVKYVLDTVQCAFILESLTFRDIQSTRDRNRILVNLKLETERTA